jgi:hypothetical protein
VFAVKRMTAMRGDSLDTRIAAALRELAAQPQ